jgi:hypothetical protein
MVESSFAACDRHGARAEDTGMGHSTPLKTSVLRIPDYVHPFRPEKTFEGFSGSGTGIFSF